MTRTSSRSTPSIEWARLTQKKAAEPASAPVKPAEPEPVVEPELTFRLACDPMVARKLSHFRTATGLSNSGIVRILLEWVRPAMTETTTGREPVDRERLEDIADKSDAISVDGETFDLIHGWAVRLGMTPSRLFAALWNHYGGAVRATFSSRVPAHTITPIRIALERLR